MNDNVIHQWEISQVQYVKTTMNLPNLPNQKILELANLPTIKNRIKTLAKRWLTKCETNNNEDVLKFIHCEVKTYKTDKIITPHELIKN